jgi:hypothetical protein
MPSVPLQDVDEKLLENLQGLAESSGEERRVETPTTANGREAGDISRRPEIRIHKPTADCFLRQWALPSSSAERRGSP